MSTALLWCLAWVLFMVGWLDLIDPKNRGPWPKVCGAASVLLILFLMEQAK